MGRRGRTSAAALSIVRPKRSEPARDSGRPDPPGDLTEDQAAEWRAIVARMPIGWFPRETYPLLVQYCRHAVSARFLGNVMDKIERAKKFDLEAYERVAKLIGRETQLLSSLATKMRLSQHSSYDKKKSKGPTAPKPWEE